MDIWVRTMSSEYRRDSDVPRLRDESAGDAERGGPPQAPQATDAKTELFDGKAASGPAKDALGPRPTLGALIGWYAGRLQELRSRRQGIDRHLISLAGQPIAKKVANSLTASVLVQHAQSRLLAGAKPSTIGVDLSLISTVLEAAKEANIVSLDLEVVSDARRRCRRDGLVGSSDKSARRITDNELKALSDHFTREDGRLELPMQDLMWFALHSTRRVSEICRLEWQDNEPNNQSGLVRDGSRPHEPNALHKRFRMTREAWDIVNRQPRHGQYIFPYKPRSIGIAFSRACMVLGVTELTFDNLWHEGIIRLFERGLSVAQVREHALCDTLETLQRCQEIARPHLRQGGMLR